MQGIKVLVNNPCPPVKREGAFEDTMFLIDLLKQSREKEIKEKKEDMIRNMALEQKMKKRLKAIWSGECCRQQLCTMPSCLQYLNVIFIPALCFMKIRKPKGQNPYKQVTAPL